VTTDQGKIKQVAWTLHKRKTTKYMGDEHDSWLEGIGVDIGIISESVARPAESTENQNSIEPLSSGQAAAPTISTKSNGDGSFTVTGSGFLQNSGVTMRVVDDALNQFFFQTTSDSQGRISVSTASICQRAGNVHFSATDGRRDSSDLTGNLWSNTTTTACPAGTPPDKGDDDPDPGDTNPAPGEDSPGTAEEGDD
jgi:hypothetical protein